MCEFVKKVIVPVGAAGVLAVLFYPLCVENGQCDYLKLWMFVGIPFGVHRMFLWIIPKGFDIVIGGVILVGRLFMAVFYLMKIIAVSICRLAKAKTV